MERKPVIFEGVTYVSRPAKNKHVVSCEGCSHRPGLCGKFRREVREVHGITDGTNTCQDAVHFVGNVVWRNVAADALKRLTE